MTILISRVLSNGKGNLDLVKDSDSHRGRATNITPKHTQTLQHQRIY